MKKIIVIGILGVFIISSIMPMTIGYYDETGQNEEYFENLKYCCYNENNLLKISFLRDYLLEYYLGEYNIESDNLTQFVETPSNPSFIGPMDSPWPMICQNNYHRSSSPYATNNDLGEVKWRFFAGYHTHGGSPVINNDETTYRNVDRQR